MLIPVYPPYRKRNEKPRSKRGQPAPPPVLYSILHVRRTDDYEYLRVELSAPLNYALEPEGMLEIYLDGSGWVPAMSATAEGEFVELRFPTALYDASIWRVPTPANWVFADDATLDAPYSGNIEG